MIHLLGVWWEWITEPLRRLPTARRFDVWANAWERKRRRRHLQPLIDQLNVMGFHDLADQLVKGYRPEGKP